MPENYDPTVHKLAVRTKEFFSFITYMLACLWYMLNEFIHTAGKLAVVLFIVALTACVSLFTAWYLDVQIITIPFMPT